MQKLTVEDQRSHDQILEHEIAIGFRTKDIPAELQAQLEANGLTVVKTIRLTRMNPRRRKSMNEAVQRAFFRDLQNPEILSNEQILKLVTERGEWSSAKDESIKELQKSTNAAMSQLYIDGFTSDSTEWMDDIMRHSDMFRDQLNESDKSDEEKERISAIFNRWVEYSPDKVDMYTEKFATEQGTERYSPERDSQLICDAVPSLEVIDAINSLEEALDKLQSFVRMNEERKELAELQMKRASIFADSVEGRKENSEEMARLYFTSEVMDGGKPSGPFAPTFDELWDLPDDVIQWLLVESYFFHNGIPDETRPYLETFGFIRGEVKESTASKPSEESPAPPEFQSRLASVAGNAVGLFGVTSAYELDEAQLSLVHWAKFYKSVFEMSPKDKPVDELINNDFELDRWFDGYIRDAQRRAGARTGGFNRLNEHAMDATEWRPEE